MTTDYGVLWDMDGVLVDTAEFHFQTWLEALSAYGIPLTRDSFRTTFGMNNAGTLAALLGEAPSPELVDEIGERKERQFRQVIRGQVRPLPGVLAWLERLQSEGVRQGVASSAPPANIDVLLDELGLRPFFDVIGSGSDLPPKPDPSLFLQVARLLGVPAGRCVVVEDSVAGVQAARRAGMGCIAVTTTSPPDRLEEADLIVERLDRLPEDAFRRLLAQDAR
jgi:HAD superfamily hydrolase (TIGR01509 family)